MQSNVFNGGQEKNPLFVRGGNICPSESPLSLGKPCDTKG